MSENPVLKKYRSVEEFERDFDLLVVEYVNTDRNHCVGRSLLDKADLVLKMAQLVADYHLDMVRSLKGNVMVPDFVMEGLREMEPGNVEKRLSLLNTIYVGAINFVSGHLVELHNHMEMEMRSRESEKKAREMASAIGSEAMLVICHPKDKIQ